MWNFVGRQNSLQGYFRDYEANGGWVSGINFIDDKLGFWGSPDMPQAGLPDLLENEESRNEFYFIPLILGIIGLVWMAQKNPRIFFVVLCLFIFTGLLQIIYHNQPPVEPRERDYVFVGSFWAFTIWIGFAVMAIIRLVKKKCAGKNQCWNCHSYMYACAYINGHPGLG